MDFLSIKTKYRYNYSARLAWSISVFIIVQYYFDGLIIVLSAVHLGYSILWALAVELNAPFIRYENLRYVRITMDAFFYTIAVYVTGGIHSFLMLSYVIFIIMASMYTTHRFGIYTIIICIIYYNAMLLMIYHNVIPSVNILASEIYFPQHITMLTVAFTNFVLIFVSLIMHRIAHSMYVKLNDISGQLEHERKVLHERNDIIEKDLKLAQKIQLKLIPDKNPYPFISTLYKPMEAVGGDFYDFISFRDSGNIGIFISDVSGHGAHAAFITSMIKTLILQAGVIRNNPRELLLYLNHALYGLTADNFVTAFYGIYNPQNYSIVYSVAGHNLPYVISDTNIIMLQGSVGPPLAIDDNNTLYTTGRAYENITYTFKRGDLLLMYTDGLVEEHIIYGPYKIYGEYMEKELLPYMRGHHSNEVVDLLYANLKAKSGKEDFKDDICIICVDVQ